MGYSYSVAWAIVIIAYLEVAVVGVNVAPGAGTPARVVRMARRIAEGGHTCMVQYSSV